MFIRTAEQQDWSLLWPIVRETVRAGETYGYDPTLDSHAAKQLWLSAPRQTFLVEDASGVLGTYYIKTNNAGPGRHVCNCGYMVAEEARGKGLATMMCEHSQQVAIELGYKAMQFNFVASSNAGAVRLWHKLGFNTVGVLPKAFNHPSQGLVDAFVMYKWLEDCQVK